MTLSCYDESVLIKKRKSYKSMNNKNQDNITPALDIVCQAGHIMLENGAEISRVEDAMERIARAYGIDSSNFFVLSNGIFTANQGYANVQYIPFHGSQLDKVVAIDQLARDIETRNIGTEEAEKRLSSIRNMPNHPAWEQIMASAFGSGAFCAIFGGSLTDCFISFLAGLLLWVFVLQVSSRYLSKVTGNIAGGAFVTIFCIICHHLGFGTHLDNILIGAVIPLVPGVAFTNGIRDIAAEDYIAGCTRLADALMVFFCIALGVMITFIIDGHIEGNILQMGSMANDAFTSSWMIQIAVAFIGTMAFAVIFGVARRDYIASGTTGTLGWIAYLASVRLAGVGEAEASFFATIIVAVTAYLMALRRQCPVIVFLVCGIFPLVPGAGIFRTTYYLVSHDLHNAMQTGFIATKCTFAIVFAIIIVTEVKRKLKKQGR